MLFLSETPPQNFPMCYESYLFTLPRFSGWYEEWRATSEEIVSVEQYFGASYKDVYLRYVQHQCTQNEERNVRHWTYLLEKQEYLKDILWYGFCRQDHFNTFLSV